MQGNYDTFSFATQNRAIATHRTPFRHIGECLRQNPLNSDTNLDGTDLRCPMRRVNRRPLTSATGSGSIRPAYAHLLLVSGSVRLAPLYDLISSLPYPHRVRHYRDAALAMRIDREYRLWKIRRKHWEGLAARCDLDPAPVVQRVGQLAAAVPAAVASAAEDVRSNGVRHEIVERLELQIREHSKRCLEALDLSWNRASTTTPGRSVGTRITQRVGRNLHTPVVSRVRSRS